MTNEELTSLEPIIAQAWDHWDQQVSILLLFPSWPLRLNMLLRQRRMHFAHHPPNPAAGKDGPALPPGADHPAPLYPPPTMSDHPHPYVHDPSQSPANDFRARFHRQLTAPSPFRTGIVPPDGQVQPGTITASSSAAASTSTSGSVQQGAGDGIDVSSNTSTSSEHRPGQLGTLTIDPQLGQARDEAAGVAGKLER